MNANGTACKFGKTLAIDQTERSRNAGIVTNLRMRIQRQVHCIERHPPFHQICQAFPHSARETSNASTPALPMMHDNEVGIVLCGPTIKLQTRIDGTNHRTDLQHTLNL